jgi:hypothetical protein
VGAQPGRGAHRGLPGRAPRGRGDCLAVAGGLGRRAREHLVMLRQPTVGMRCLPALVCSGTLPRGSRGLNSLQPYWVLRPEAGAGKISIPS